MHILKLYFNDNMSPMQIGKMYRMSNTYISSVITQFKNTLKKQMDPKPKLEKVCKSKNPELLNMIRSFIKQQGTYNISIPKMRTHLLQKLPASKVPCAMTIRTILRNTFGLRFRYTDIAKFRYRNPFYHEKRLYISRLMAQFLHDNVIVISVDETSIRSDASRGK